MLRKKYTYPCKLEGQSLKDLLSLCFEKRSPLGKEAWKEGYVLKKEYSENHLLLRERLHNKAFSPLYELQYAKEQLDVEIRLSYYSWLVFLFPLALLAVAWMKELTSGFYILAIVGALVFLFLFFWVLRDGEQKMTGDIQKALQKKTYLTK